MGDRLGTPGAVGFFLPRDFIYRYTCMCVPRLCFYVCNVFMYEIKFVSSHLQYDVSFKQLMSEYCSILCFISYLYLLITQISSHGLGRPEGAGRASGLNPRSFDIQAILCTANLIARPRVTL